MAVEEERYKKAEDEYFRLKGQLASGRITREQFESALKDLMVQDARGRYWVLGTDTGKWHVHDGSGWVESDPYALSASPSAMPPARPTSLPEQRGAPTILPAQTQVASPPPPPRVESASPAPKKGGGCGKKLLIGCLALVCILLALSVGGYFAIKSGALTTNKVLNLFGAGSAEIEVDNFRDDVIQVSVQRTDPVGAGTPTPSPFGQRLNAFEVRMFQVQQGGKFRVEFRAARDNSILGTCNLSMRGGDHYHFVALPERIAVNRNDVTPPRGADLVVQASALCR